MTRPSRWALALRVLTICWISKLTLVEAAAPVRVVLITADRDSPTARRFIKELNTLDVEVVTVTGDASAPSIRKELERVAAEQHAFAAVRIVPTGNEAEVWVADRVTGKTLVREVISGTDAGQFDEAVSLGAVELLRASLLEVATDTELKGDLGPNAAATKLLPPPKSPALPKTPDASALPAATTLPAFMAVGVGPSIDLGFGQLGAAGAVELDLKVVGASGWGGELLYRVPFSAQELRREQGDVFLQARELALMGCYAPVVGAWLPALGLGAAAASIVTEGQADATMVTRKEQRLRWLAIARAGIGYRILPSVGVRLDATAGYSTTPLVIRVANRNAAEYGRPFGAIALGIELRLPAGAP